MFDKPRRIPVKSSTNPEEFRVKYSNNPEEFRVKSSTNPEEFRGPQQGGVRILSAIAQY